MLRFSRFIGYLFVIIVMAGLAFYMIEDVQNTYYKIPNFERKGQKLTNWCWAASLEMVHKHFEKDDSTISQMNVYREVYGDSTTIIPDSIFCTGEEPDIDVNRTGQLGDITYYLTQKKINSSMIKAQFLKNKRDSIWGLIKTNLYSDSPVIFNNVLCKNCAKDSVKKFWDGHTFVCSGFLELDSLRLLYIQDPWRPLCEGCTYYLNFDSLVIGINNDDPLPQVQGGEIFLNIRPLSQHWIMREVMYVYNRVRFVFNQATDEFSLNNEQIGDITKTDNNTRVCTIGNPTTNKVNGYFVQVVENGIVKESFTVGISEQNNSFYLDSYQQKCLITEAIDSSMTNIWLSPKLNPYQTLVHFTVNNINYQTSLDVFNIILRNRDFKSSTLKPYEIIKAYILPPMKLDTNTLNRLREIWNKENVIQ